MGRMGHISPMGPIKTGPIRRIGPISPKKPMTPTDHTTELAELAGGFIHEIKNHLSTFGLHLQLLAEDFAEPESPRERKALDRELFKQALLNLLLNAQQAMPEGGQVTVQGRRDDGDVRLDLIDTGIGMSAESLAKCFHPFHTTKPGGNGLGLPTTRRIIEMHGGRITVQSEPGKGTQFTVWLPIESSNP